VNASSSKTAWGSYQSTAVASKKETTYESLLENILASTEVVV